MEIVEVNGAKLYKWKVGPSSFLANPAEGARLMNWYISMADGMTRDIIYWPENAPYTGEKFGEVMGGNPILFPFCGANFAEGRKGFWKSPDGQILPMKMHGYAIDGKFELVQAYDNGFTARFLPSAEASVAYPYSYDFFVKYRFSDLSFSCELNLVNNGSVKIPWGAGLHPYFILPWNAGAGRKDYRILHDAKKACNILDDGSFVPVGVEKNCFADSEIYNRIHTNLKTGTIKFGPKNGEEDVSQYFASRLKNSYGQHAYAPKLFERFDLLHDEIPLQSDTALRKRTGADLRASYGELEESAAALRSVMDRMAKALSGVDLGDERKARKLSDAIRRLASDIEFLAKKWNGDAK